MTACGILDSFTSYPDSHIPPTLLGWIASFLDALVANLRVGSASSTHHLSRGVPQGSPLSPILFLVYIQNLLETLWEIADLHSQAYADDPITWWILPK